ncbi:unnamed protein product [Clonostachys rosea]|uniref:Uncharacterized protein n=1 Tax=Bionectria ochroleuca TaxID=29856 RepID=A0ABY6UL19_BIOOC|nr:unnamed protein product [Clonostachys rosea]
MPSCNQIFSALAVMAVAGTNAAFGPSFSTGPVASNSFIRESTSTLVLPSPPTNNEGDASLWVGMGTSNGDLIQSIADNAKSTVVGASKWNIFAYTLLANGPSGGQEPVQGDEAPAVAGDKITMHYKYNDSTKQYDQTTQINGVTVSTLSTTDGYAQGWGSAVECAAEDCGSMGAHTWTDTKIILDVADPNYSQTMVKSAGVTGEMSTSDGGKTWTISTISIPAYTF